MGKAPEVTPEEIPFDPEAMLHENLMIIIDCTPQNSTKDKGPLGENGREMGPPWSPACTQPSTSEMSSLYNPRRTSPSVPCPLTAVL